jgi:hypothetical protein
LEEERGSTMSTARKKRERALKTQKLGEEECFLRGVGIEAAQETGEGRALYKQHDGIGPTACPQAAGYAPEAGGLHWDPQTDPYPGPRSLP